MAKKEENKKGEAVALANITEENVIDQIKNANKYSKEIVKLADEQADKEQKERMARELNQVRDKATYINLKSVLKTRLIRAQEKAVSEMRKKSKELLDKITSGDITANDYDNEMDKELKRANDSIEKANEEFENNLKELKNQFPSSWSYEWDNPFRRIRRVNAD